MAPIAPTNMDLISFSMRLVWVLRRSLGTSIRAKKALGQHFLRDENILRKIASVAEHIHPVFPW